jgi:type IV fimbrial biogenesis protein FimT
MSFSQRIVRGFTVIELLITVAIVAILVAIAAPEFDRFTTGSSLDMTTDTFQATLGYARSEALKRGTNVSVRPNDPANWGAGWQTYVDTPIAPSCATVAPAVGQALRIHEVNRDRTVFRVTTAGTCNAGVAIPCLTFNGRGRLVDNLGNGVSPTLCVSDSRYSSTQRRVGLNIEGQYFLEKVQQ